MENKTSAEALWYENIVDYVDIILALYEKCAVFGEDMGDPRVVGIDQDSPDFEEFVWQMEMLRNYRSVAASRSECGRTAAVGDAPTLSR